MTQFDHLPQTVGIRDRFRRAQGGDVDIGADETPAVFAMAQQRINEVRAGAHIQYAYRRPARNVACLRVARG